MRRLAICVLGGVGLVFSMVGVSSASSPAGPLALPSAQGNGASSPLSGSLVISGSPTEGQQLRAEGHYAEAARVV